MTQINTDFFFVCQQILLISQIGAHASLVLAYGVIPLGNCADKVRAERCTQSV